MPNEKQLRIIKSRFRNWNVWRANNFAERIDLMNADLSGIDLIGADLHRADLHGADLRGTNLLDANLNSADLRQANLGGAILRNANLIGADLSRADLLRADLSWANLLNANLSGTNLSEATLYETFFAGVELSSVAGIEHCKHLGPSTIDHRTLLRSGKLPPVFLQGCGLPDSFFEYMPSLSATAIQFYSCFISYSTSDQLFADRLYADLQNKGVRCWFAPHDLQAGKRIHEQIDVAIRAYDRLLLILSQHSMNSEWVKTEIAHARQKELNEKRRVLFPISVVPFEAIKTWKNFDADAGKDSARAIREYFIPDFSNWKDHGSYSQEFERLLRDLRAAKEAGASKA